MIQTGFESRVKIQQIVNNQLPEFILDESPKAAEFLKQYYISQEFQGASVDLAENLDQYIKLDNLTPEVIVGQTILTQSINSTHTSIFVESTKGFPPSYGLFKIDDEIITYTGITTNSFTGCIRGFSGITDYHDDLKSEELVFSTSTADSHNSNSTVINLSSLFLQEIYKKLKYSLTPGLENVDFISDLNVGNFIKEARSLYDSKGTPESFRILFNVLFGENPKVIDLEQFLIKPSDSEYIRREIVVVESISGNPLYLKGQTIFKSTDIETSASVSEVETITRSGKTYYKLLLFLGYDDTYPTITGTFGITASTKNLETVSVGSSAISVDSTIGFPSSGKIYSGNNEITYTSKSINQFFGCSGVTSEISTASVIRSNETYYGYENGDTSQKVEFRITGVLSNVVLDDDNFNFFEQDELYPLNLGEIISNPEFNANRKEIFANTWSYNTRSRFQINSCSGNNIILKSSIDKSNLKSGDFIEILDRGNQNIISGYGNVGIRSDGISGKTLTVDKDVSSLSSGNYDIRRKLKTSSSLIVPFEFNSIPDVLNVYDENSEYLYVASNSIPSYPINVSTFKYNIWKFDSTSYNPETETYSILEFQNEISFITGDRVYYDFSGSPIDGLERTSYYVELIGSEYKKVKLHLSLSSIGSNSFTTFGNSSGILPSGTHSLILYSQRSNKISPQKILKKFSISPIVDDQENFTIPGHIGMLNNGVEIYNYKSNDKIYYGPLENVNVLNGGEKYDVINPPLLEPSFGNALFQPVITGSVEKIYVDPQDFNIDKIVSIKLTGGNGKGVSLTPVIAKSRREIEFDARSIENGGGLDSTEETIFFTSPHNLINGQEIIYDSNNFSEIGIGSYKGSNNDQSISLKNGSSYYVGILNDKTIQLYSKFSDYTSGINTVGFTTIGNVGIQKFKTEIKNTLSEIKVINGGDGYTNRLLRINSSGISTYTHTFNYQNHGFSDGEIVTYDYETAPISGLSTTNQYYILTENLHSFRVCDAGIGGTNISNYERKNYVKFTSKGSGYQIFNYPNISLELSYTTVGLGSTQVQKNISAIPIVRGKIQQVFVYDKGSDYGSTIVNFQQRPTINIKTGNSAQLRPIISNGRIVNVSIQYGGDDYYSTPELNVIGSGSGASLRAVLSANKIVSVIIVNPGANYSSDNTSIVVESSGKNAVLQPNIRSLTLNNSYKYGSQKTTYRDPANEVLIENNDTLQYTVIGYSDFVKTNINDDGSLGSRHSPIIGWAYDGNPIYGPYGYSDSNNINSPIKKIESSYSVKEITNRPGSFPINSFVEDYEYNESGDLDEYNGRFTKTPEFPNGVYAYFTTISTNVNSQIIGKFPYFIGNKYRSKLLTENSTLNQSFDFNNSSLVRNTLPYKVNDPFADYDFFIESNEIIEQKSLIESVTSGTVTDLKIINSGTDYLIGDELVFDDTETSGGGLAANVLEVQGKDIIDIKTSITSNSNSLLTWESGDQIKVHIAPYHELANKDNIIISGLTTESTSLNGFYKIGVSSYIAGVANTIPNYAFTGIVTDIYLTEIPNNISIGSSLKIENEVFSILNSYPTLGILRVSRSTSGVAHTQTTPAYFLTDSFTIDKKISYFDSKKNNKVYFNPQQSVGVGTTPGTGIYKNYSIGITTYNVFIPTQSIFLPGHPFSNGEEVTLQTNGGSSISASDGTNAVSIFSGATQKAYVINKSKDFIGIVTNIGLTTTSSGLFFLSDGSNSYFYSIETNYKQSLANITRVNTVVSVSTSHNLNINDSISLQVNPNISVGIGTSTSVNVKFDSNTQSLIINPIIFTSSGISTSLDIITISNHNLKNGDKVVYNSTGTLATGLSKEAYYVYKIDKDRISLCQTYTDSLKNPPIIIDITGTGSGSHSLSLINPQISVIKNNNLIFNLSDSSLQGYNFKIYYDKKFTKEFFSDENTSSFSVIGVGTVGVTSTASLTLNYTEKTPERLYYALEKSGFISTADTQVVNYSEIVTSNSDYNGIYNVNGVGTTNFTISLRDIPERLSYSQNECDILEYSTKSINALGGAHRLKLSSGGYSYRKLPRFNGTKSNTGSGLFVLPISNEIGKIKQERIVNEGFEYSSDKTLRPTASIPKSLAISSANTINSISVINGGRNYYSKPDLVCVNTDTGELIDSGFIEANLTGSSINYVKIEVPPRGLPTKPITIRAINNSNGITINKVEYSSSGIVTCTLTTPITGFTTSPFSNGEKIFVEGIQKLNSDGDGFNSTDHGYQFFTISSYLNSNPAELKFNISGFTTNPGSAKLIQESYASIIKFSDYPQFEVIQSFSSFLNGEKLLSNTGSGFLERDLTVIDSNINFVRVIGSYNLSENEIIKGRESLSEATIVNQSSTTGKYEINYSNRQNLGWNGNSGKLNEDFQVISDNDYYQNLSYTVKSSKTWEEIASPVNNLLHTSGLKNFADVQIENTAQSGIGTTESNIQLINNYISENRVDTIHNFDLVLDVDASSNTSKFLKFKNVKLADYILCKTNRVLEIDDISSQFSSTEDENNTSSNIVSLNSSNGYNRFLIETRKLENNEIQFDELITINNDNNIYTLRKASVFTGSNDYFEFNSQENYLTNITGVVNENLDFYLNFEPKDAFDSNFNIKILQNTVTNTSGIGSTEQIGFIDLINVNKNVSSGVTTSLLSLNSNKYTSLHLNAHISNTTGSDMNYVEIYVSHDGTNTYLSEYYFDNETGPSSGFIGSFGASVSGGILSLNYTNTSSQLMNVRTKTVGFGTTALGNGSYRFKLPGQLPGNERTVLYTSQYTNVSSASTTLLTLNTSLFSSAKSVVKVSSGSTSALHQVMTVYDGSDSHTLQYPFLSIGSTSGIGTFGSEMFGGNFILKFYPDASITGNIEILSFNEIFYKDQDFDNIPPDLNYGAIVESVKVNNYYGANSIFGEKLDFQLNYDNTPIFSKIFDPSNTDIINYATGVFTISEHFFSSGEELIYTPRSTFIGIGTSAMGIGATSNYLGVTTTLLPTKLWAIKDSNNTFRLATRKEYASQGIGVTFTSVGLGNAHQIEIYKKNEKSLITINNVPQYPIIYTSITHTLSGNGGQIDADKTIFALSGISSVSLTDILKIDNEYMKVTNIGVGTTSNGPISFNGSVPLVEVVRGFLGSNSGIHTDTSLVRVYRGSYNISGNKIYFTEAPKGNSLDQLGPDPSNLPRERASFSGRVFLRQNYESNVIYDDISTQFNGIKETFTLTTQGINTTGIGTSGGNGIVFINNIFQTPTTLNNLSNNYEIKESVGISSIRFTGITSTNGLIYKSTFDVNQNQLPRGGLIVSLGSTSGLGYAPLVGASVTAIVGAGGSIVSIGIGTTVGSFGSGYRNPVSVAVTETGHTGAAATIQAIPGSGGVLSFTVIGGGSGYTNPTINVSSPSYENLSIAGVSRLGIGTTTSTGSGLLLNVEVGASSTSVGIGSTLFEVKSFKITRPGYGFQRGDVFTPVGLVTARGFASPLERFEITVLEVFNDSFAAWQFGELDYIDSIKAYQDGVRKRFPLFYNGNLLSFEIDENDSDSQLINFSSLLVIFVNGVLQKSGESYQFDGGTSFTFSVAPKPEEKIDVFFYRGTRDQDTEQVESKETVKIGDTLQVFSNNNFINNTITQNPRIIYDISGSDKVETNLYIDQGIDSVIEKPVYWTKQKEDLVINGQVISKVRNSLETQIYPTANIIKNISSTDIELFVDDVRLFDYDNPSSFDAIIVDKIPDPISAKINAAVSVAGTISSLQIIDGGSGYVGSGTTIPLLISAPDGIVTKRASAYATVSAAGTITTPIVISNPGVGYTTSSPPQIITEVQNTSYELLENITTIEGVESSIVGISTTTGIGVPLAIRFTISPVDTTLTVGYPIYVSNTTVGNGVTSINTGNSDIVSISTSFVNNIYYVHAYNSTTGILTCNVASNTSVVGIATTGTSNYPVGKLSWGRLSGFTRSSSPISIGVSGYTSSIGITTLGYSSGLSTYPIIQRRGIGLRGTGSLEI